MCCVVSAAAGWAGPARSGVESMLGAPVVATSRTGRFALGLAARLPVGLIDGRIV
jgi:hypothetical protein